MERNILVFAIVIICLLNILNNKTEIESLKTELYWCELTSQTIYWNIDNCESTNLLLKEKLWQN